MTATLLLWAVLGSSSVRPSRVAADKTALSEQERSLQHTSRHYAEFAYVSSQPLALPKCASVRPPEALLTPDPLIVLDKYEMEADRLQVRVSFIVGSDGRVHSAFVLSGGGMDEDAVILQTVRAWRYRPAMCNGVPTDSEARVRFTLPR